jgi:hypothetical protein
MMDHLGSVAAAEDGYLAVLNGLDELTRLTLGMVASLQGPLQFHLVTVIVAPNATIGDGFPVILPEPRLVTFRVSGNGTIKAGSITRCNRARIFRLFFEKRLQLTARLSPTLPGADMVSSDFLGPAQRNAVAHAGDDTFSGRVS